MDKNLSKIETINKLNNDTLVLHDESTVLRETKQDIPYTERHNRHFDPVFSGTPAEVNAFLDAQLPAPVTPEPVAPEIKKK